MQNHLHSSLTCPCSATMFSLEIRSSHLIICITLFDVVLYNQIIDLKKMVTKQIRIKVKNKFQRLQVLVSFKCDKTSLYTNGRL